MTKIDRTDVEDRYETIDDEKKRALDLWDVRLVPPEDVGIFDEPTRCYRINLQWAKIVMGMVSWLAELPMWKDAQDESYFAISEILRFLEGVECMSFELRQNPDNSCLLEQTTDGGETWTTAFDFSLCNSIVDNSSQVIEYNNYTYAATNVFQNIYNNFISNYVSSPGDVYPQLDYGTSDPAALDAAYCNALYVLVTTACNAAIEYYQEFDAAQTEVNQGLALAAAVITIIGLAAALPTAGTSLTTLAPAAAMWGAAFGVSAVFGNTMVDEWQEHTIAQFEDEAAREEVVCYIVDNLSGEDNTQSSLQSLLDSHSLTGNAGAIADTLALMLQHDATYAAFLEKWDNNLEFAEAGIELYCPCEAGEGYTADFTLGSMPANWTVENGTHVPGTGVTSVLVGTEGGINVLLTMPSGTFSPSAFSVEYERQSDGSFSDDIRIIMYSAYPSNSGRINWESRVEPAHANENVIWCPTPDPSPAARPQLLINMRDNDNDPMILKRIRFWSNLPLPANDDAGCLD